MTPAALPTEPSDTLAEWERRHLTVLFCDVVNSTRMAAELDPEDWRDALAAFQQAATAAVEQQGGYVAQYSGDGIVVYFGYPHAFEDNVSRGVRAGLRIVDTARTWTAGASAGVSFAVRIGIHIGLTVVGLVGDAERHEPTALGHTTNMAARLRTVAPQNGVVVSESVRRLTAGEFATEDLGLIELRGLGPTRGHLVLGATGIRSRLAASEHAMAPARPSALPGKPASASRDSRSPCAMSWRASRIRGSNAAAYRTPQTRPLRQSSNCFVKDSASPRLTKLLKSLPSCNSASRPQRSQPWKRRRCLGSCSDCRSRRHRRSPRGRLTSCARASSK
jgi:class 3 adenylate cyclase